MTIVYQLLSSYPSKEEQYHFFRHYLQPEKPDEVWLALSLCVLLFINDLNAKKVITKIYVQCLMHLKSHDDLCRAYIFWMLSLPWNLNTIRHRIGILYTILSIIVVASNLLPSVVSFIHCKIICVLFCAYIDWYWP